MYTKNIYIEREREKERESESEGERGGESRLPEGSLQLYTRDVRLEGGLLNSIITLGLCMYLDLLDLPNLQAVFPNPACHPLSQPLREASTEPPS